MMWERVLAELTPLQREIVSSLLRGEEEGADEALARRHPTSVGEVRSERFQACDRLRRALDPRRHSDPYLRG